MAACVSSNLDHLLQELAKSYSKVEIEEAVEFTKNTLHGEYLKLPGDDILQCFKLLQKHGRISESDTKLLNYYAEKSSKESSVKRQIEQFKSIHIQEEQKYKETIDFVGRDRDVKSVMQTLFADDVHGVNLYGAAGVGKTTLAQSVVDHIRAQGIAKDCRVDLCEMKKGEHVCFAIMQAFGMPSVISNPERLFSSVEKLRGRVLLFLDNAEELLKGNQKDNDISFIQLINGMISHDKGSNLKILLTSRIPVLTAESSLSGFISDYHVKPFSHEISISVLQEHSGINLDVPVLDGITRLCSNKPFLLKGIRAILQEQLTKGKELLENVNKKLADIGAQQIPLDETKEEQETRKQETPEEYMYEEYSDIDNTVISEMFDKLSPELKKVAINLSMFKRPFSTNAVEKILSCSPGEAVFFLNMLTSRKFVEQRTDKDDECELFDMHPLVHEYLEEVCMMSEYQQLHQGAKSAFFHVFIERIQEISSLMEKDYIKAYSQMQTERLNIELALSISQEMGFLVFSSDFREMSLIANLFDRLATSHTERLRLFRKWNEIAEERGEWLCSVNLLCMELICVVENQSSEEVDRLLCKAEDALNNIADKSGEPYELVVSSIQFAKGEIALAKHISGRLNADMHLKKALKFFKRSLAIRKRILKDHTDTARCLNAIGNCYMRSNEHKDALTFYNQAFNMRQSLTGSLEHVDMPVYIQQIGAVHDKIGKEYKKEAEYMISKNESKELLDRANREFEQAIESYEKALDLERKLHTYGNPNTATFYRNMAYSYFYLGVYDSALDAANKALCLRKKLLGVHPDTVRSLYQVGVISKELGNVTDALQYFYQAYRMEHLLPQGNRSAVRDNIDDMIKHLGGSIEQAKVKHVVKKQTQQRRKKRKVEHVSGEDCSGISSSDSDESTASVDKLGIESEKEAAVLSVTDSGDKTLQPVGNNTPRLEAVDDGMNKRESVHSKTVGSKGCIWKISETGIRLSIPAGAVADDTAITCRLPGPLANSPPLELHEGLVSEVISLEPSHLTFEKDIEIVVPHSAPIHTKGYEMVVKMFSTATGTWEELKDFENVHVDVKDDSADLGGIESQAATCIAKQPSLPLQGIQLTTKHCCMLSVTCRLIKDSITITKVGGNFTSSVFPGVKVTFDENAVSVNTTVNMRVQSIPDGIFNTAILCFGPVLHFDISSTVEFLNPVTICVPHPLEWQGDADSSRQDGQIRLMFSDDITSVDSWKDVTCLTNMVVGLQADDMQVSFKVKHFSKFWPVWVKCTTDQITQVIQKSINRATKLYHRLCTGPPVRAEFCVYLQHPQSSRKKVILGMSGRPKSLPESTTGKHYWNDSTKDIYNDEEIEVKFDGNINRLESLPVTLRFHSTAVVTSSTFVDGLSTDGVCKFLRVESIESDGKGRNCLCSIPIVIATEEGIQRTPLEANEFYGIPFDDEDLSGAPNELLAYFKAEAHDEILVKQSYNLPTTHGDQACFKLFYKRMASLPLDVQRTGYETLINGLLKLESDEKGVEHIREKLETGKRVVETCLDESMTTILSEKVGEDYLWLWKTLDIPSVEKERIEGETADSMKRCYAVLQAWREREGEKATLQVLMEKMRKAGIKEGVAELNVHFSKQLAKSLPYQAEGGYYEEHIPSETPLMAAPLEGSPEGKETNRDVIPASSQSHLANPPLLHGSDSKSKEVTACTGAFDDSSDSQSPVTGATDSAMLVTGACVTALLAYLLYRFIRR